MNILLKDLSLFSLSLGSFSFRSRDFFIYSKQHPPKKIKQSFIGSNCHLIEMNNNLILVDTGLGIGSSHYQKNKYRHIISALEDYDFTPKDIDIVVLTHLHLDHYGGLFYYENNILKTFFINSNIYVHGLELDFLYRMEDKLSQDVYWFLKKSENVVVINKNINICDNIFVQHTGGHTPGQMIVKIDSSRGRIILPSDIIPTQWHINNENILKVDFDKDILLREKRNILEQSLLEGSPLGLSHSHNTNFIVVTKKTQDRYICGKYS